MSTDAAPTANVIATEVLVVGAGLAGLRAAADLQAAGRQVLVVDKGRGLGGRLAGRRIGDGDEQCIFDHGAQFLAPRHPRMQAICDSLLAAGAIVPWDVGYGGQPVAGKQYRGAPTMTAIAKHMALGLDVRRAHQVKALSPAPGTEGGWLAQLEDGAVIRAQGLVVASPVPQTLALFSAGGEASALAAAQRSRLEAVRYSPCLAAMAVLDAPSGMPAPGGVAHGEGPLYWVADSQLKGISAVPGIVIHADAAYSAAHLDDDRTATGKAMVAAAQAAGLLGGASVLQVQVHGWRYSK